MASKNYVKSDGNGGYDINVQKEILRKWGPVGLVLFVLFSGFASSIGSEVWDMLLNKRALEDQVGHNSDDILELKMEWREWRSKVDRDLNEIKEATQSLEDAIVQGEKNRG